MHPMKTNWGKKNLNTDLTVFRKIDQKWIIDPNVKCKATKLLEDNLEETPNGLVYFDDFLDVTTKICCLK